MGSVVSKVKVLRIAVKRSPRIVPSPLLSLPLVLDPLPSRPTTLDLPHHNLKTRTHTAMPKVTKTRRASTNTRDTRR